jgi:uncharacterized membrane protein
LFDFLSDPIKVIHLVVFFVTTIGFLYIFIRFSEVAFEQVGFNHRYASLAIFGSIFGSLLNMQLNTIPLYTYPDWYIAIADFFNLDFSHYYHPVYIAINVGGCIVPIIISVHLLLTGRTSPLKASIGILAVTVLTYSIAEPVPNEGILLPFWVSPLSASICGLILAGGYIGAPALAYISGTIGTLLGADILNLLTPGLLPELAPLRSHHIKPITLSIGGAGVFDGIFLTGVTAVLLAAAIICIIHRSCNEIRDPTKR